MTVRPNHEFFPRSSSAHGADQPRSTVAALLTTIYFLLLFEGAIRKYLLPSLGQALFFIRDPLVLAVYWVALRHSLFPRHSPLLIAAVLFGAGGLLLIVAQTVGVASGLDLWPMLAAYGWRNYFLYMPLPFVVGATFNAADLRRIMKLTLLAAVPIAFLVLAQFRSPPTAPINVGFAGSFEQQFRGLTVDADHIRPSGTFSSDVGQREFVVSCVAMLMALWIMPPARRFLKSWQLLIATGAVLSCLAVSGSRGTMLASGLVGFVAVTSALILKRSRVSARAVVLPVMIALGATVLYPILFPDGYNTFINRWAMANAAESQQFSLGVFGRALYGFIDFFSLMGDTPIVGYGLGLAGNASLVLGASIPGFTGWAETDWARHIVDLGPVFGVAYIVLRISIVLWLGATCLRSARAMDNPLPLLLFAFVGNELLTGQLTGNGTVNGYAWLFAGFCLAACNAPQETGSQVPAIAEPPLEANRFANLMR